MSALKSGNFIDKDENTSSTIPDASILFFVYMFGKCAPINNSIGYEVRWFYRDKKGRPRSRSLNEKSLKLKGIDTDSLPIFSPRCAVNSKEDFYNQFEGFELEESRDTNFDKAEIKERKWSNYGGEYLNSKYWETQKNHIKKLYKRCVFCNSEENLCVHHRTYKHRGEKMDERKDLFLFCRECHETLHKTRPIDGKIRLIK